MAVGVAAWSRYIPTHVGKSEMDVKMLTVVSVHPHARGEIGVGRGNRVVSFGTSPRTWGNRRQLGCTCLSQRYIPTHVGKSCVPVRRQRPNTVHPHARGEIAMAALLVSFVIGTSPRTWGNLIRLVSSASLQRYIPTHVGKSAHKPRKRHSNAVHPHARGEILTVQIHHD